MLLIGHHHTEWSVELMEGGIRKIQMHEFTTLILNHVAIAVQSVWNWS